MAHNVYYVKKHGNQWTAIRPHASKGRVYKTKPEAIKEAHRMAENGVVHIEGPHGLVPCSCKVCGDNLRKSD